MGQIPAFLAILLGHFSVAGRTTGFFRTLFRRGFSPKEYMGNYLCAGLINTPLQRGVWCCRGRRNRFNGFIEKPLKRFSLSRHSKHPAKAGC